MVRESLQYARYEGVWYQSCHAFHDTYPTDILIGLYHHGVGMAQFRVPGTSVERMETVWAEARYRGVWFGLGSIWTTSPELTPWPELSDHRVRDALPFGADGYWALLYTIGDEETVRHWPEANETGRGESRWDVWTPLAALEDYRERTEVIEPR